MQINSKLFAVKLVSAKFDFEKPMKFITTLFISVILNTAVFGHPAKDSTIRENYSAHQKKGINIYLISKDKYFDLTNRIIVWQAKLAAFLHPNKLKIILVTSTADAEKKITALVNKHHCTINNIWFDSHGKYRKRYSSFMIGTDEYDYKNIADSNHFVELKKIASYCSKNTNVGIGSCYAASDFNFPVMQNGVYENMHGDSLLKGMANIFKGSDVYSCKSWVMAKPWIFGSRSALAGYPLDKQYKDTIFLQVWKSMGEWHRYSTTSNNIETINTVYLSNAGEILINNEPYLQQKKAQRKLARNLKRLAPNLYDLER